MVADKFNLLQLESVTISGAVIRIIHRKPKKSSYGEYDCAKRTIELNNDLKGKFALRVLIHEMEHAKLRLAGMDYHLSEAIEEQLCTMAESYIDDILGLMGELLDGENN